MKTHITLPENARILVIKMAGIGDLLLATPTLRALRETYPHAQIDLLVTPASAGLLDGWEVINRVIVLDKYLFDYPQQLLTRPRNLLRLKPLWQALHGGNYDAVLLLQSNTAFWTLETPAIVARHRRKVARRLGQRAWLVPQCACQRQWLRSHARGRI